MGIEAKPKKALAEQIRALRDEVDTLQAERNELNKLLEATKALQAKEHGEQISTLQAEIAQHKESIAASELKNKDLEQSVMNLTATIEAIKADAEAKVLQAKADCAKEIEASMESVKELTQSIANLDKAHKDQIASLEQTINEQQTKLAHPAFCLSEGRKEAVAIVAESTEENAWEKYQAITDPMRKAIFYRDNEKAIKQAMRK